MNVKGRSLLKDYTRSTMTGDRLNGLALMYIHRDIVPDAEKVIDLIGDLNSKRVCKILKLSLLTTTLYFHFFQL